VRLETSGDEIAVYVGGQAVTVLRGDLIL
jgi:hypothetical protein